MKVIKIKASLCLLATVIVVSGCVESNTNPALENSLNFSNVTVLPSSEELFTSESDASFQKPNQVNAESVVYGDVVQIEPDVVASNRRWIATDAPLVEVRRAADLRLKTWLNRPSELPAFDLPKPVLPAIAPPITLVKGEFETTFQFEDRIKQEQLRYDEAVDKVITEYELNVKQYNDSVAAYTQAVRVENEVRQAESEDLLWQLIYEELQLTLGRPYLQNAFYDADTERFLADLVSTDQRFFHLVTIDVPLEVAPEFKQNLDKAMPLIAFSLDESAGLAISDIAIEYEGDNYTASIFDAVNIQTDKRRILKAKDNFKVLRLDEIDVQ